MFFVSNLLSSSQAEHQARFAYPDSNQIRTRTLDVHIRRVRTKLESYSREYLETLFGIGYRFQPFHANRRYQAETPSLAMTAA
jgi:DNA-binding response OmpR family regulator